MLCRSSVGDFSFASPEYLKLTLAAGLTHIKQKQRPNSEMTHCKGSNYRTSSNESVDHLAIGMAWAQHPGRCRGVRLLAEAGAVLLQELQGDHCS